MTGSRRPGQKLRYLLAGGLTFVLEYASFVTGYYGLGLQVNVALTLSFLLALAVGFALNNSWTFRRHEAAVRRQLVAYTALALVNLGFTNAVVPALHAAGVAPALGKIVAQCCVVAWNYLVMSRLIFSEQPADGQVTGTA